MLKRIFLFPILLFSILMNDNQIYSTISIFNMTGIFDTFAIK